MSALSYAPITLHEANAFVAAHHRHNKPTRGARFCLGAFVGPAMVGVAIVGRPVARALGDRWTAEVTRLCVLDCAPKGACSFLYQAAKRAWQAQGGRRLITYTLASEGGASLRGAGWSPAARLKPRKEGQAWTGPDRARDWQPVFGEPKVRWEAPP